MAHRLDARQRGQLRRLAVENPIATPMKNPHLGPPPGYTGRRKSRTPSYIGTSDVQTRFGRRFAVGLVISLAIIGASPRMAVADSSGLAPADLAAIDQTELGTAYSAASAPQLPIAHELIERYFAATTGADRSDITDKLNATGLSPNVVGRLARIRLDWAALPGGVYYIDEPFGAATVRYFLGVPPAYDRRQAWPLVIKLPVANAFASRPSGDEVARIYGGWISAELLAHPDALVLMPLLNLDELYGPSYAGMNTVIQPMLHSAQVVNVDPARVYLIGHSMAAHAVWNLGLHYTTYFAAINPMAGSAPEEWQRVRMINLLNVLPVVWADADDKVVSPMQSRQLVAVLKNHKIDVDYQETRGLGHMPSDEVVESLYKLVRGRTRALYPKGETMQSDRPDTMFNRLDWVQVYQQIDPGQDREVRFTHGSGTMTLLDNAYAIGAVIDGPNHIRVISNDVESMRIYLNDQMVDFSKPVTVEVNNVVKFAGLVKPDMDVMLKDQMFLGRGWRYFTGIIDLDTGGSSPATRSINSGQARSAGSGQAGSGQASSGQAPSINSGPGDNAPPVHGRIQIMGADGQMHDYVPGSGAGK